VEILFEPTERCSDDDIVKFEGLPVGGVKLYFLPSDGLAMYSGYLGTELDRLDGPTYNFTIVLTLNFPQT
jgi:hypothetical protein